MLNFAQFCSTLQNFDQLFSTLLYIVQFCSSLFNFAQLCTNFVLLFIFISFHILHWLGRIISQVLDHCIFKNLIITGQKHFISNIFQIFTFRIYIGIDRIFLYIRLQDNRKSKRVSNQYLFPYKCHGLQD